MTKRIPEQWSAEARARFFAIDAILVSCFQRFGEKATITFGSFPASSLGTAGAVAGPSPWRNL